MLHRRNALTPEALAMIDTIARTGSFAAAARELGKVPSALTYSVRQLEEALDVLLFDRSSRQARFTAAGSELLLEGRRVLEALEGLSNRVQRVASGWEAQLAIGIDDVISMPTMFDLVQGFCDMSTHGERQAQGPATRLRIRSNTLAGTWEALISGQVDLAIGVTDEFADPGGIEHRPLGDMPFVFAVAPHHPLASVSEPLDPAQMRLHRAVAVADTAQRIAPITVNILPGQDVLTVPTMRAKLEAQLRGLGCGYLPLALAQPHIDAGRLVLKATTRPAQMAQLRYAWRVDPGSAERGAAGIGKALQWWLERLEQPATREALLQRHAGRLN
jgi:DNA-binding transcriptional LysR family regulator